MTSRQRALHGIFSTLGFFPPEFRERCYRWGAGLGVLFGPRTSQSTETQDAVNRLGGYIFDLVLSGATAALSESARERWFNGLVEDAWKIDGAACASIRKYARAGA